MPCPLLRIDMDIVARFELLLLLIGATVVLDLVARRLSLPPAAALIVGGIALALTPGMPDITLDPGLALVLFLPPLLLGSAYFTVWRDFRADLRIILQLAVGAVVFTTAIVGVVAHWALPSLPWSACFALGAIVSPPDAVSAKAVLARVKLPQRMVTLLEGESLVNDATGIVLFRIAVAAGLTGTFDAGHAALSFMSLVAGGLVVGLAFGWLTMAIMTRLGDPTLIAVISFLAAWASYIGGEALHVSGVLSTVACGIIMGIRQHRELKAATRMQGRAVWQAMTFVLESMVFILIGLTLRPVLVRLDTESLSVAEQLPAAVAVVLAVILSRAAWVFPAAYIPRLLLPGLRRHDPIPPVAVPIILSWAGMRGVVSLAAALSLPVAFQGRDFVLATTFLVILVTVLVQGSTLAPLIRILNLSEFKMDRPKTMPEDKARVVVAQAQLDAVERESLADGAQKHPRLVEQYGYRARASARFVAAHGALEPDRQEHYRVVLAAISAGRERVLQLHQEGQIHDSVLHTLENELDLEELGANRFRDDD